MRDSAQREEVKWDRIHSSKRPQKCEAETLGSTDRKGEEQPGRRPGRKLRAGRKVGAVNKGGPGEARRIQLQECQELPGRCGSVGALPHTPKGYGLIQVRTHT